MNVLDTFYEFNRLLEEYGIPLVLTWRGEQLDGLRIMEDFHSSCFRIYLFGQHLGTIDFIEMENAPDSFEPIRKILNNCRDVVDGLRSGARWLTWPLWFDAEVEAWPEGDD